MFSKEEKQKNKRKKHLTNRAYNKEEEIAAVKVNQPSFVQIIFYM